MSAPAGGQRPVLALDVVDDRRARPGQQRRQHQTDAFAGARRRHCEHVLRAIVTQIALIIEAEDHALIAEQTRLLDVAQVRPAGRAIGGNGLAMARPPGGSPHSDGTADDPPEGGNGAGACEHVRRLTIKGQPPGEDLPWRIKRISAQRDHRRAEGGLELQHRRRPLCGQLQAEQRKQQCQCTVQDG